MITNVLTISLSDSVGWFGIQADVKTFTALGAYSTSVVTAITAHETDLYTALSNDIVISQLEAVLATTPIKYCKVGWLGNEILAQQVGELLSEQHQLKWVFAPGFGLLNNKHGLAAEKVRSNVFNLMKKADITCLNCEEAIWLAEYQYPSNFHEMKQLAWQLMKNGNGQLLITGGNWSDEFVIDCYATRDSCVELAAKRDDTPVVGAGCSLAAALVVYLSKASSPLEAIRSAKSWVTRAIHHSNELKFDTSKGSINHLFGIPA
ncbi:bifunctional hydroxymethylpyrimidine kinase/phosphomethylpyrimidine kinase [Endozoicomonas sp. SM1973]|uniref:Bifunctional hydroxymethylpyrimidine kinase/phosphomethylpyrimidine kinase n=1 Tax=Spartinivicinus marinus TaxID=2994442 RepID=A0A853I7C4_9GAMM|nr:bifunctional hydroxymethylpyrimidine kinase/phosphomethylpyrimidine kinase [Spartinivicinus marinus]MCX4025273.1 bifunctional hydroxymethylpyrimidine kinase/phosphomethylpyrimidine kinase [Spartinivicinus marinus]NYZ65994.1 bifunctional hydroxymethylpyrimidine kinase/phosphomethylpyrimidine kinase [Spartinivicinus marinus]